MNLSRARAEYLIEKLRAARRILILADGSVIHMDYWNEIAAFAEELLVVYHRENPISEGMDKEEFKSRLNEQFRLGDIRRAAVLLAELVKRMAVKTQGAFVAGKDFSTEYSKELRGMMAVSYTHL